MNLLHRWYCRSEMWAHKLQERLIPWAIREIDMGEDVLEIGPGPGKSTDWLRQRVPRLTAIEIDRKLAEALKLRMEGTNVTVVEGDATVMPFPEGSFSAIVCFTMLHHVPSVELQNRLVAEAYRVLRPGGTFAGTDSLPSPLWNLFHVFDTRVPVDPATFGSRLEEAKFREVVIEPRGSAFRFAARRL